MNPIIVPLLEINVEDKELILNVLRADGYLFSLKLLHFSLLVCLHWIFSLFWLYRVLGYICIWSKLVIASIVLILQLGGYKSGSDIWNALSRKWHLKYFLVWLSRFFSSYACISLVSEYLFEQPTHFWNIDCSRKFWEVL